MSDKEKTIGEAIDEMIAALQPLDEGARLTAVRAACEHLGIVLLPTSHRSMTDSASEIESLPQSVQVTDIRTLKEQKMPTNATEMACVVAYYLESVAPPAERKREVSAADMEKYFKQAGFRLPRHIGQLLVDARGSGYFDSAGRAKYKLNPVGHNLVVHNLPKAKK